MVSILDIFLNEADDRRLYCYHGNRLGTCKTLSDSNQTVILTARRVELGPMGLTLMLLMAYFVNTK